MVQMTALALWVTGLLTLAVQLMMAVGMAVYGLWLQLPHMVPGLAFSSFLLWLSVQVRRRRHLVLGMGVLGCLGLSAAISAVMMHAFKLPVLVVVATGCWAALILGMAVLIGLARRATGTAAPGTPGKEMNASGSWKGI